MHLAAELAARAAVFENGAIAYPFAGHSPLVQSSLQFCSATHFTFYEKITRMTRSVSISHFKT
jgi:hypothetical protein